MLHLSGSTEGAAAGELLTRWLLALLTGAIAGIGSLALGSLGLALAMAMVLWALVDRPRGVALAGALVGLGGAWLVVWGRAVQWCAGLNTATDGCVGPDLSGLLFVPILVLAAGGVISFVSAMRSTRRRAPPPDEPASAGEDH